MTLLESLKQRARALKADTMALYLAARHPQTPWYAKLLVTAIVAYALSPIDLIPDFIPLLGYLDDLVLLPLGIVLAVKLIPAPVLAACRAEAQALMLKNKPVSFVAGVLVVVIWVLLALLFFSSVYKLWAPLKVVTTN